jgi:hypothetical protein
MRRLVTALLVAALLAGVPVPSVLAGGGHHHHGSGYGHSYYAGHYFKHRPYYGHRSGHHYRHHGHGRHYYIDDDAAVVLGVLAGVVVLGALLSRPAPVRPSVLRSPTGTPLRNCLATTGTGIRYGRPAQFSGTMCYDPAGRAYVLPGSVRFVGYLR